MPFELWRQDDNGNRFLVATCSTRESAEAQMRGSHKQTYRSARKAVRNRTVAAMPKISVGWLLRRPFPRPDFGHPECQKHLKDISKANYVYLIRPLGR